MKERESDQRFSGRGEFNRSKLILVISRSLVIFVSAVSYPKLTALGVQRRKEGVRDKEKTK